MSGRYSRRVQAVDTDSLCCLPFRLPPSHHRSKLLSMMSAAEGVTAYCREHLRGTRVVCAGTKHK